MFAILIFRVLVFMRYFLKFLLVKRFIYFLAYVVLIFDMKCLMSVISQSMLP